MFEPINSLSTAKEVTIRFLVVDMAVELILVISNQDAPLKWSLTAVKTGWASGRMFITTTRTGSPDPSISFWMEVRVLYSRVVWRGVASDSCLLGTEGIPTTNHGVRTATLGGGGVVRAGGGICGGQGALVVAGAFEVDVVGPPIVVLGAEASPPAPIT